MRAGFQNVDGLMACTEEVGSNGSTGVFPISDQARLYPAGVLASEEDGSSWICVPLGDSCSISLSQLLDSNEDTPTGPVARDVADSADEREGSSHIRGGNNEIPATVAPLVGVSEIAELQDLLGDARSLVFALDDHLWATCISLSCYSPRQEIAFLLTALAIEGLIAPVLEDVVVVVAARQESTC
ncbi:hypothetical protein NE237_010116 [Protea cynaroides]|uniref:Uncharacterized protein n=1 Tax=Protea cynaroides TaxID=273540 RepID=A0A9Q0KZL3_9MAGN|nr:hypothetical protein NE237_010116 [Protea cynaroides]